MLKLKLQYFGHLMQSANSLGKNPDAGKDWKQEKKGMTENEMAEWHHQLNGHEFQQALGDGEGQGRLACCSPWGCKESDMTVQMNNNVLSNVGNKVWKIQSSEDLGFMDEHHTPWCGVLRFMGSQRVGHDWATELNWTGSNCLRIPQGIYTLENEELLQIKTFFSIPHPTWGAWLAL